MVRTKAAPEGSVQIDRNSVTETANAVSRFLDERHEMVEGYKSLTIRERQYFHAFHDSGFNGVKASKSLGISPKTGDIHWTNIRRKLGGQIAPIDSYEVVHFMAGFIIGYKVQNER